MSDIRRFFFESIEGDAGGDGTVFLSEEESHHAVRVLRMKVGEPVELLDGRGAVYGAEIIEVGRRVRLRLEKVLVQRAPVVRELWLGQAILKGDKMDAVVQKCTELGVDRFFPLHTSRCQGKFDGNRAEKKHQRWQRIALEACKQCRRPRPMVLEHSMIFEDFLDKVNTADRSGVDLLFWEEEHGLSLANIPELADASTVSLILGPEGGLAPEEVELARSRGFRTVGLGERILRAETASLAAVAIVQYLAGNM